MLRIFDKRYNPDGPGESNCLSISAIIALVVLIVATVMYALYLFIHALGISEIAGVHITKNLMLATKSIQGKLYTNQEKGIKDWIIYKDETIGVIVKYPNDLIVVKNSDNELEFKKNGSSGDSKEQSLLYAFVIGKKQSESSSAKDFMRNKYPQWNGQGEISSIGGKEGLRTGVFKSASGIFKDAVYWKLENRDIYAESRYYTENSDGYKEMFNKIISEISII